MIFNERKLVLELLRVVTVTMKKFEIASIARWLVILLGTYRYWTRQTNIVKKGPILSNIDQYCSVLFNIVQVTISAGSDQSYIIVRNIRKLSNIVKYILILLGIDLYCLALTKYSPVVPCLDIKGNPHTLQAWFRCSKKSAICKYSGMQVCQKKAVIYKPSIQSKNFFTKVWYATG